MTQKGGIRLGLTAALVVILVAPVVWSRLRKADAEAAAGQALGSYGFRLEERSRQVGLQFVHEPPRLHPSLDKIMPVVAAYGAAVSVADFDRDGDEDLYVTNSAEGSQNRLFRNRGNGTFEDVAAALGVADLNRPGTGASMGSIWGDYDNDGYEDLFLYKWGRPELLHNDAGKGFTPVTQGSGLPGWTNSNCAVWLDYDRDGLLDLFLGGYYRPEINLWRLTGLRIMPDSFSYAVNGSRKWIFRNLGGGRFRDVTAQLGLNSTRWALAAGAADLRGTGYPDLVIANDYGHSEYWANEGGKRFVEIGKKTGIGMRPRSGMNVSFGDIASDGRSSIYVTNISEPDTLLQLNDLWVPERSGMGAEFRCDNKSSTVGVDHGGWSFGAQFGDLNNDGFQDLFLTNGFISAGERSFWYDYSKITGAAGAIIEDAAQWPAIGNMSLSGHQQKRVWLNRPAENEEGRRFVDVAREVGVTETHDGRAVVLADLENRGALDAVVAHQGGPLLLYRNSLQPDAGWVQIELEGTKSNRSAIGAVVRLEAAGWTQTQHVTGGSGFSAQNGRRLHFGLGKVVPQKLVIQWPSGRTQALPAPRPGRLHRIQEPA